MRVGEKTFDTFSHGINRGYNIEILKRFYDSIYTKFYDFFFFGESADVDEIINQTYYSIAKSP